MLVDTKLTDFMLEKGRLPYLEEEGDPTPWSFKGWNLPNIQLAHLAHPAVPNRWGYLTACIEKGEFPEEPIPELMFDHATQGRGPSIAHDIRKAMGILIRHGGWSSFRRLVDWIAWSLGVADEPPDVSEEENEKLYRFMNFGPWLISPSDHLGTFLSTEQMGKGKWNPNAFYPTPHSVVEAMAAMLFHDAERKSKEENGVDIRALSVLDCCVGTGRMLMHAGSWSMNLFAQDVDPFVLTITKINGALYVPWLIAKPQAAIDKASKVRPKKPKKKEYVYDLFAGIDDEEHD